MISRNTILVTLLVLAGVAWAQIGDAVEFPADGAVTGSNVYIRSAADATAYTCGKVGESTVVVVVARDGDWLQIVPPEGCFSIISKDFVELSSDNWGTVTGTPVRVRAGSSPDVGNTQRHSVVQGYFSRGDEVEIIGEGSDFYRIPPPNGVYVWISASYVRLPGQPAPEKPAGEPAASAAGQAQDDDEPSAAAEPLSDAGQQFIAADNMLIVELQKALPDQQLLAALEMYEAIEAAEGSPLQGSIARRIIYVQSVIKLQGDVARAADMAASTAERRAELERQLAQGGQVLPEGYAAQGVLSASYAYADRFLLRDPATNADVAYVRDASDQIDLSQHVGQMVGVSGRVTYEPDSGLNIVDVTKVVVLTAVEPATVPTGPVDSVPPASVTPVSPEPVSPPRPASPPAERTGDGPPAPVRPEPISLQPDRTTVVAPPTPEPQPELELPAQPDGPGSDEMPTEPVRPPRLITPRGAEDGPAAMPERPSRPARPSTDRPKPPRAPQESEAAETPTPDEPSPPAEAEDQPEEPDTPEVEMHTPLPPEGLPIEDDDGDGDGPDIDTSEYE